MCILGVAQLINKLNDSPFDDQDDQLFEVSIESVYISFYITVTYAQ